MLLFQSWHAQWDDLETKWSCTQCVNFKPHILYYGDSGSLCGDLKMKIRKMLEVCRQKTLTIHFTNAYRVIRDKDGVPAKLLVSP